MRQDDRLEESVRLHSAVRGNEHWGVGVAIERGADVDFAAPDEPRLFRTPLRAACAQGNVQIIRALIDGGAQVFAHFEEDRWSALHSAAERGHDHIIRVLLMEAPDLFEDFGMDGFSLFHVLSECLCIGLPNDGVDVLAWAVRERPAVHIDTMSTRLGYSEWTPLHTVCARGCVKAAACLLKAGAQLNARTGEFFVGSAKVSEFVRRALASGPNVAGIEPDFARVGVQWLDKGLLPIHVAALGGHLHAVNFLLKRGQSVNATTSRHRWTPLMFAIFGGCEPLVKEVLRIGGRGVVNVVDRRGDGTEWTPLALAVVRGSPEIVRTLVAYGADPLVRLRMADFPGRAFLDHCPRTLPGEPPNQWSGPDGRVSLVHLAVVRGNLAMLREVIALVRAARADPTRVLPRPPPRGQADKAESDDRPGSAAGSRASGEIAMAFHLPQEYSQEPPACEGPDYDPLTFCTVGGWSPAILSATLHAVDPHSKVWGIELLRLFPDPSGMRSSRADIFLELLGSGCALLEDRPTAPPPVIPQRFVDVSEGVIITAVDELTSLCKAGGAERVAYRILHTTLCMACRFNRFRLVQHLLEAGLCDPCCRFLRPIEYRPLHIATACGFGFLAQLLLEHRADPLERDDSDEYPIAKLSRCYEEQVAELQARVADLEDQLQDVRPASAATVSDSRM